MLPENWWQWLIAIWLSIGVLVFFVFSMAGALRELPAWRVITSSLIWPYILYLGIRDELNP